MFKSSSKAPKRQTISVVIPVFNEGDVLEAHCLAIFEVLDSLDDVSLDLIIVDDGSTDDTLTTVRRLQNARKDLRCLCFTRNFGKEAAILAGLDHARGDAAVVMDSDLQHPPAMVAEMLAAWRNGASIVEACKEHRGRESFFYSWFAKAFYRVFDRLSGLSLHDHSDFKLLDRAAVDAYRAMPEKGRFFRGLMGWLSYPSVRLPFQVPARAAGSSAWSQLRLLRYSIIAITSFSALPLQFVTILGLITLVISFVFGAIAIYDKFTGAAVSGFTTVILLILIIGSILMVSLGILGIYIARIYEEIKGRPSYVLRPPPHCLQASTVASTADAETLNATSRNS